MERFTPPGPGQWELDRSHFPSGTTAIARWLMEQSMQDGMRTVFAEVGVPAESLQARFVRGFMYTRLRPLVAPDKPSQKLPPAVVLKVLARLHPAFRRRNRRAAAMLAGNPSAAVVERWNRELRPALERQNRAWQAVDLDALTDAELAAHIGELLGGLRRSTELHFYLHGHDLGPIARYLHRSVGWGLEPVAALSALAGASPSTARPVHALVALRAIVDASGTEPGSLDDVRRLGPEAAGLLDDHLDERGAMIITGYDVTSLTLAELPDVILDGIRTAVAPTAFDHAATAATLREAVPAGDRSTFDRLLEEARGVMDMRDDNGPLTYEWPLGLLRRALLAAGRRLHATGAIHDPAHALDLTPDEARDPFGPARPSADALAARVAERLGWARLEPPAVLGPAEPQPPLDVLPHALAESVAMVQTALEHLEMAGAARVDPMAGTGIGTESYVGRARIAHSAEEAIEALEPGDVLVVRATSPAFNTVLSVAGAVVTTHGGALSHAAVIARELGIPAVIGASGALDLPDGATIEVDPRRGRITVLSAAQPVPSASAT
jgi:pyruvate,water dikinase